MDVFEQQIQAIHGGAQFQFALVRVHVPLDQFVKVNVPLDLVIVLLLVEGAQCSKLIAVAQIHVERSYLGGRREPLQGDFQIPEGRRVLGLAVGLEYRVDELPQSTQHPVLGHFCTVDQVALGVPIANRTLVDLGKFLGGWLQKVQDQRQNYRYYHVRHEPQTIVEGRLLVLPALPTWLRVHQWLFNAHLVLDPL